MKKEIRIASLTALCIILGILESLIPIFNIPGFKLGLANIIILTVLYIYSFKDALFVSLFRVLVIAILRSGFGLNFILSISGAITSLIAMMLFKKAKFSVIGVSVIGSVTHSLTQLLVITLFLKNSNLIYYLPYILIISCVSGIIISYISKENIRYFNEVIK